jgi:transposase InsO family protein
MANKRKKFSPEGKVRLLRLHLIEKEPVSDICDTFYYLCSILDGFSRYIVHWEIREAMKESDAQRLVIDFVDHYNNRRLHSAIEYITPKDKLQGRAEMILAQRDAKLVAAREDRKAKRKASPTIRPRGTIIGLPA